MPPAAAASFCVSSLRKRFRSCTDAKLFPRDTVQSRLPDPAWLEAWLDKQIQFDAVWENKVVERILHNMSLLMERSFASVQDLNRFRKELTQKLAAAAGGTPGAQPA